MHKGLLSDRLRSARGFTLLETFAVIGILTLLVALATPALLGAIRASRLTAAGDLVAAKVVEAQGLAMTFSSDVELRFYRAPAVPPSDGTSGQYLQLVQWVEREAEAVDSEDPEASPARFLPMGSKEPLPAGVGISLQEDYSSLWRLPLQNETQAEAEGGDRDYVAVRFRPDGSTHLSEGQSWHLTLVEHPEGVLGELPANFYTLQIDPVTGRLETYRPD